jgi:DNA-binding response OmpR family regulator
MLTTHRILVVDDDPSILALTTAVLHDEGYEALPAPGGARALEIAKASQVDLILLDLRMPDVSGWDVARELKRRASCPPIVVITASPDAARVAREIGAAGYIEKPFALNDLLQIVARLCSPIRAIGPAVAPRTHGAVFA